MTMKGVKVSNTQAYAGAAQMSAEMLGLRIYTDGIESLSTKIPIQHTAPLNLLHLETRTQFIKDFLLMRRCDTLEEFVKLKEIYEVYLTMLY
jgi:hypothetical protein